MSLHSDFYNKNAQDLCSQYDALRFEDVHQSWSRYWPASGSKVLDLGAGSGRDAKWFEEQGCEVFAIEPSEAMRTLGQKKTGLNVSWLDDSLPALTKTENLGIQFDLILLSAVWMHIAPSYRERAFRKLSNLLAPHGKLVISLRHGQFDDGRKSYEVSVEELETLSKSSALHVTQVTKSDDYMKRRTVWWETAVMTLPDDGTGDLKKIRHIIVNDSKSATYKLALLRTLLRIADAHSGAVIDRSDGKVAIPLGLVALYWIRQFKRLIDKEDIQQNSNSSIGLGFIKPDGWGKLKEFKLGADDLSIGAMFLGEQAKAFDKTIRDSIATIKDNPVKFTYQGSAENRKTYFTVERERSNHGDSIVIDTLFLQSYGKFILDESLWDCFRLYHSWIEPLVINQWIKEMQRFKRNKDREISLQTYFDCLVWIDKDHDTRDVRKRVEQLRKQDIDIHSVWSGSKLRNEFHVDHCLPFTYWPNNDKWNLLPTTTDENLSKSDKVPTAHRLHDSKQRVLDWWQLAWGENTILKSRFFSEASLSLPTLPHQCSEFEEVFEAMGLQVKGVKSRLLINEW